MLGAIKILVLAASLSGSAVADHSLEGGVLKAINALRVSHGLVALRSNPALAGAAAGHAFEMAADGYFSHDDVNGAPFSKRIIPRYGPTGYGYWQIGENLLWSSGSLDAQGAVTMWWNSPGHRENMMRPSFREIGLSAVHENAAPGTFGGYDVTIVTADFGVRR